MKKLLNYVPGFIPGGEKVWKQVIELIYYTFCLIVLLSVGVGVFLVTLAIPFILFSIIRIVFNKKERNRIMILTLLVGLVAFSIGWKLDNIRIEKEIKVVAQQKVLADNKVKDDAAAKVIADAKAIENKIIADKQAIIDKETARIKAIEDKKIADAQAVKDKLIAKMAAEQDKRDIWKAAVAKGKAGVFKYDTGISYDQLARNPNEHKNSYVKFSGKVVQVMEGNNEVQLRIAVNDDYDTILLVFYDPSIVNGRILDGDVVNLKGVSMGIYTYDSTMGGSITVPLVKVDSFY